ncbi:hypothetical protein ACFVAJ_10510 [Agromyces sp. NPDC057679]|uniref:hypothetical protein n=1 Tax=Agromyces sp. NPDC057679 TaxID=3346207 RepID=UPI00366A9418
MSIPSMRVAALAAAGALALVLSACAPEAEPSPEPTPTAGAAPIFASDEEALAAAVEAYEKYAAVSRAIMEDGGAEAGRIEAVVSERYAPTLVAEFEAFKLAGVRSTGGSSFDGASLVDRTESAGEAEVSIYLCRDVANVRLVDAAGLDRTPQDRKDRVPSQAFLVSSPEAPDALVVDGVEQWLGDDFC